MSQDAVGAAPPPAVIFEPMELVRAAHEAAAEQALHRSRTFQHLVLQTLSEAEADLLIEAEASSMEHRDLGQALRGPLGTLETALREKLEQHRRQEADASREALHALSSQLRAQHDEQIRKQAAVLDFSEKHAEAKLKAARCAAQTRLVEARAVLERQCEARLAEAAQQAAAQLEAVRAEAKIEGRVELVPQLGLVELLEGQAQPRARLGLGLGLGLQPQAQPSPSPSKSPSPGEAASATGARRGAASRAEGGGRARDAPPIRGNARADAAAHHAARAGDTYADADIRPVERLRAHTNQHTLTGIAPLLEQACEVRLEAALRETALEVAASRKEAGLVRQEAARCKEKFAASQALRHATPTSMPPPQPPPTPPPRRSPHRLHTTSIHPPYTLRTTITPPPPPLLAGAAPRGSGGGACARGRASAAGASTHCLHGRSG